MFVDLIDAFEGNDTLMHSRTAYEEALSVLSSLIVNRRRCDKSGDRFELMFEYVKVLLELNLRLCYCQCTWDDDH